MTKLYPDANAALAGILHDGMLLAIGGFGLCGIPEALILALRDSGVKQLTIASNNAGVDDFGLAFCLRRARSKRCLPAILARTLSSSVNSYPANLKSNFARRGHWLNACAPAEQGYRLLHSHRRRNACRPG